MDIFGNFSALSGDKNKRQVKRDEVIDFSYADTVIPSLSRIDTKESPSFVLLSRFVLTLVFLVMLLKVFYLQVVQGEAHQKLAEDNRFWERVIEAPRGLVADKDGVWLARNKPDFALSLFPSDLPRKISEREAVIEKIAVVAGLPIDQVREQSEKRGNYFLDSVILKDHLTHDEALVLEEQTADVPGVVIAHHSSREYASIPGLSHLLGYTGAVSDEDLKRNKQYRLSDTIGQAGLEKIYEDYLRGVHGAEQVEVDSRRNVIRILAENENRKPVPGYDLTLYLDRGLQVKSTEALQRGFDEASKITGKQVNSGVAMVMDVKTGGMLAMVTLPSYDNNLFSNKISAEDYNRLLNDESKPLFNRAIQGTYPPGSIIKIVMASAGLSEGVITSRTSFDTPPAITIGEYSFPDWKDHGATDVERAIAESNNIFFYAIGGGFDKITGIGIDKIKNYWQLFGLGEKTGIDLPGEEEGLLPDAEWKEKVKGEPWYLGDTYHVSIGQGDLLITPLQMLRATAVIANGGKLLQPQLVKQVTNYSGEVVKEFGPRVERENFLSREVVETVARGMRMTVTEGSARSLNTLPVPVAGKTGTAQFMNNEKTHAWFEAYAPYDNPEIAVIVLIESGGGGNETAAPVAKEILDYYFNR